MGLKDYCGSDNLWPDLSNWNGNESDTLGTNFFKSNETNVFEIT